MSFTCIIPAYNEAPRIEAILKVALECPELDKVIVVDDGSTDATKKILESIDHPKLIPIYLEKNGGKMKAFFAGLEQSRGDYIFMLDADYSGFKTEHISTLIHPIKNGSTDSTMMMWYESLWICKLMKNDMFSGTRVLPSSVFENKEYFLAGQGFGLETKINELLYQRKIRVKSYYFPDVHNPSKGWKQLLWKQPRDILKSMPLWKVVRQAWYFYRQQL